MTRFFRRIIQIKATDSPNVQYALAEKAAGKPVTNTVIIPGVLPWADYAKRRATWDPIRQSIGLDAEFWEGAEVLLYPPLWLDAAEAWAHELGHKRRQATAIGIDPAEGGDKTSMCAIDDVGVIELLSRKTPDTNMIPGEAIAFMKRHGVKPENVYFDRGGGGKQHADRMRAAGYDVQTVSFGEGVSLPPKRVRQAFSRRVDVGEQRVAYKNRRAQMYGLLRHLIDPGRLLDFALSPEDGEAVGTPKKVAKGFAIPPWFPELREQMSQIPLTYNEEQVMYLLPKSRKPGSKGGRTLTELVGHSPDELDSLALAAFGLFLSEEEPLATGF